jgi:hypothetical protein
MWDRQSLPRAHTRIRSNGARQQAAKTSHEGGGETSAEGSCLECIDVPGLQFVTMQGGGSMILQQPAGSCSDLLAVDSGTPEKALCRGSQQTHA